MNLKKSWLATLSLLATSLTLPGAPAERPSILIVNYDDQSWFECSAYGAPTIPTPHFDQLAREGALFQVCYASAPSCAPSRAALLTGRNFWELEEGAFIQAWMPPKFATLPQLLGNAGYHTGFTGKGWGPGLKPPTGEPGNPAGKAFNKERIAEPEEGMAPFDYVANFEAFLAKCAPGQPFYFWAGLIEPHSPLGEDNDQKLYAEGFEEADLYVPPGVPDTPAIRRERARYAYEVRAGDRTLGRLLAALEKAGRRENTLVVVTADNGTPLPGGKASIYEMGLRVPLAVSWPAGLRPGRVIADPVGHTDLAPTFLELAGAPVPPEMTGRSLVKTLAAEGSGQIDPEATFTVGGLEWHGIENAGRAITDGRFQYLRNYSTGPLYGFEQKNPKTYPDENYSELAGTLSAHQIILGFPDRPEIAPIARKLRGPRPAEELYDLRADPGQLVNLAEDSRHAETKHRLRDQLDAYLLRTRDPRATGDMTLFATTLQLVTARKAGGYKD
jgi:N-sulfoglucosamine sulfohydrolase